MSDDNCRCHDHMIYCLVGCLAVTDKTQRYMCAVQCTDRFKECTGRDDPKLVEALLKLEEALDIGG